jgi:8-oxo-dGTP diphosphatase
MQTVTAAILTRDGKILIARRPATSRLACKWEFPGGKVEDGETPEACLARELKEELDIDVDVGALLGESVYHYEHGSIRLLAYETRWRGGRIVPRVHDEVKWVSPGELDGYEFAPADIPFAEGLKNGAIGVA